MTQAAFAAAAEVSVRTVKSWEAGDREPTAAQQARFGAVLPKPSAPAPSGDDEEITLGQAVKLMGLKDEGHGRRSDHTIRKAIKLGRLHAWKTPGYRPQYAEWRMRKPDFLRWLRDYYMPSRDPRGTSTVAQLLEKEGWS